VTVASNRGSCPAGAAPVGSVLDLGPFEMQLVIYLRLWCGGARGQTEVWQDLRARLGPTDSRTALLVFERFFRGLLDAARRPLQRHGLECPCLGGDEAAFARIVSLAAAGEREEAALILSWLVAPGRAPGLATLAEAAGLHLAGSCMPPRVACPHAERSENRPN
jgi:hypothetical protein